MRRRLGDRSDGYKLRKVDPLFRMIPHIMKDRSDAQVFFEDTIYLEETHKLIRKLRKEGYRLGFLHVVIASMVRVMSQKPKINRFVVGKKIYARNDIVFSLAIKKEMTEEAEETIIKVSFAPNATIYDVIKQVNETIDLNKKEEEKNNMDLFVRMFSKFPNFIYGFGMNFVRTLDYLGILPRKILNLSPFHSSVFITDLGSIGIRPVFHHIYNLGTTTLFIAFGTRSKEQSINEANEVINRKKMDLKIVADERVCDGYYFAQSLKLAKKIMTNPECLLTPPDEVVIDDQI